jgi:hypothetical protein
MQQDDLFKVSVSSHSKTLISMALNDLVTWGANEPQPHVKTAIIEYFNQLRILLEETHDRDYSTSDN